MMKLKLLSEQTINDEVLPIDSVIEVDDETCAQEFITSGKAVQYTDEAEVEEEVECIKEEAKTITTEVETKSLEINKEIKTMENLLFKAIKSAIETKAVETYSGTEATQPLGIIKLDSGLGALVRKQPMSGSTLNIVYSGTQALSTDLPKIDIVGEATAAATTAPLTQYSAINAKWFATVAIANEYLDDVQAMESFVSEELQNKAQLVIENSILNGTFGSNKGLKGVITSTDTAETTAVALSAITVADLHEMVDTLLPECQMNATWVINPATWSQLKGLLLDADNLGFQLIKDGAVKELLGYPVIVSLCMPAANPILIGDFSKYMIGVGRELAIEVDRSAGFLTDVTPLKVSVRLAGGPACGKKWYADATYAAFVKIAQA
jgi:hypothetical protein